MTLKTIVLSASALAFSIGSVAWSADDTLSKTESRQAPQAAVTAKVLRQLDGLLLASPTGDRPGEAPKLPLRELFYFTRPQTSAYFTGLCSTDQVRFSFRPLKRDDGPETATTMRGIQTTPLFRFVSDKPTERPRGLDPAATDPACAKLDPRKAAFFPADNEAVAFDAATGLGLVRAALTADTARALIDCSELGDNCASVLRKAALSAITDASSCLRPGLRCVSIGFDNVAIEVEMSFDETPRLIKAQAVARIVFADAKAD